jgi:rhomboid family protein
MIPIRDTIPVRRVPIVNYLLIGANLFAFVFELSLPPRVLPRFVEIYAFVPSRLWHGPGTLSWNILTIFFAMFLHAGWLHILGNMLYLYIFGDNVEDRLGHVRYLFFYLLCGVAASFAHAFFNPASRVPSLGASGAISGVLGAYLILYPTARVVTLIPILIYPLFVEIPAVLFLLFWFLLQFFTGALSLAEISSTSGGVAYFAHVGGFIAGIILLFALRPPEPRRTRFV